MFKQILTLLASFALCICSLLGQEYQVAFYSDFEPISYSLNRETTHPDFNTPQGYEIDLLKAIEAIPEADMTFQFSAVKEWNNIWLTPYTNPATDIAAGGITFEKRRLLNEDGEKVVAATHKTVDFKQSLLMHATDVEKIKTHADLTSDYIVGAVKGTTGEYRYLAQAGIIDCLENGFLQKGFLVILEDGTQLESQGDLSIYSSELEKREWLLPADPAKPITRYFVAEDTMIPALNNKDIHAIARGYIGNKLVADSSEGLLKVTAVYSLECPKKDSVNCSKKEIGVFFVKQDNTALLEKLNTYIDYLTDEGRIGYDIWQNNKNVFMERAAAL